ncbi:MAG: TolC family protein, partial [Myxococcota bacterium]
MKALHLIMTAAAISTPGEETPPSELNFPRLLAEGERAVGTVEAVSRAIESGPELARARALVERAEAEVGELRVELAPRISAGARLTRIGGFSDAAFGSPPNQIEVSIPRTQASLTGSLEYDLTRLFAEVFPRLQASQALVEAERYRAEATREAVALNALETYWTQARARGQVAVAQASLQEAQDQTDRIERMLGAGLATPADQDASRARRAAALEQKIRAEGAEETWRVSANALLNLPLSTRLAIPLAELEPPAEETRTLAALVDLGRTRRPEVRALRSALRALSAQRVALLGQRLPHLGVKAEAIYAQPNPNVIPPQEAFDGSWSVSAQLSWSPNDLFRAGAVDEQLVRDERRTKAELAELLRNIEVDVYR